MRDIDENERKGRKKNLFERRTRKHCEQGRGDLLMPDETTQTLVLTMRFELIIYLKSITNSPAAK